MIRFAVIGFLTLFLCNSPTQDLWAKPGQVFKIASLAPEGSVWIEAFKEFAAEVSERTGGEVGFRIYPGGIMGDDRSMYRKIRVGQLHGGGFTMTGIGEIVSDFRVMGIPFLFRSYSEVDHISARLQPLFRERFAEKELRFVAMTEVGFIYTFSDKPRLTIKDLQQAKTWAPSDDPLTAEFLKSLGISPIALSIPDVLPSLQTGLIDTAFNSLYGAIVLQWFTKTRTVTDTPYGYAYGAFIMSSKAFAQLSPEQQEIIDQAAQSHFTELIQKTRQSNEESKGVLLSKGINFEPASTGAIEELVKHRDLTIESLAGRAFSAEIYRALDEALTSYRKSPTNAAGQAN